MERDSQPPPAGPEDAETRPPTSDDAGRLMAQPLEPDRVRIEEDAFHSIHLYVDGREFRDVRAVRPFPISAKADYVSFLDERDKEVALIAHPRRLDRASRKVLEAALSRMYYVPKILRIDGIKETGGVSHWDVQTDRGYASFEVVDHEHIRNLGKGRFVLQDADGNRFEIEEVSRLDPRSRDWIHSET